MEFDSIKINKNINKNEQDVNAFINETSNDMFYMEKWWKNLQFLLLLLFFFFIIIFSVDFCW